MACLCWSHFLFQRTFVLRIIARGEPKIQANFRLDWLAKSAELTVRHEMYIELQTIYFSRSQTLSENMFNSGFSIVSHHNKIWCGELNKKPPIKRIPSIKSFPRDFSIYAHAKKMFRVGKQNLRWVSVLVYRGPFSSSLRAAKNFKCLLRRIPAATIGCCQS